MLADCSLSTTFDLCLATAQSAQETSCIQLEDFVPALSCANTCSIPVVSLQGTNIIAHQIAEDGGPIFQVFGKAMYAALRALAVSIPGVRLGHCRVCTKAQCNRLVLQQGLPQQIQGPLARAGGTSELLYWLLEEL